MEKALSNQTAEKEISFFQRFFYWFLIPLLFAIFLGLIIASIAGVNIFQKAQDIGERIPFISSLFDSNEMENLEEYESRIVQLDAEIQNKNAEIDQLMMEINNSEKEIQQLLEDKEQLQATILELEQIREEQKRAFKEIVATYESMSPKKSAPILLEMKEEEALKILSNIRTETLAKILENLPPKDAANFIEKLSANTQN